MFWRVLMLALLFPAPAFAYVDPGTGLLLLQGLFAAIGMLVIFIKNPIKTLKRLIARLRGRDEGS